MKNLLHQTIVGWTCAVLYCCALVCWGAFILSGATIDAQGVLHEPFVLIPLAWFLFVAATLAAGIYVLLRSNAVRKSGLP